MSYKLRVGRGSRKSRERTCESRGVCRDVCAARASLAAFAGAFAQPAQVSRRLPWRLRSLRKSCGVCRGVFAACASFAAFAETFAQLALGLAAFAGTFAQLALGLAAFAEAFAQLAQVLRRLPGRLRSLRGSCGVNRKKRGNKPAKSCSLSLLPNRRMSTLYPPSSTLY